MEDSELMLVLESKYGNVFVSCKNGIEKAAEYIVRYNIDNDIYVDLDLDEATKALENKSCHRFISKRKDYEYEYFYEDAVIIP